MLASSGLVAFAIVSLLPVELILQVGSKAGFAMVFAAVVAAIIWNLGSTGISALPASSSHTLIGSVIGVGIAKPARERQKRHQRRRLGSSSPTSAKPCSLSPIVRFRLRRPPAAASPKPSSKTPNFTPRPKAPNLHLSTFAACSSSPALASAFFHGSNDGQKGMGLIMLILIGTVPTAYALNHAITYQDSQDFIAVSIQAADTLNKYIDSNAVVGDAHDDAYRLRPGQEFHPQHHARAAHPGQRRE